MKILLTGATGFLGSHVLPLLLKAGHYVIAPTRRRLAIDHLNLLSIDTGTEEYLTPGVVPWAEIDAVLHLAASGVKSSHRQWPDTLEFNVVGTQRLLESISRYAVRRPAFVMTRTFYEHLVDQSPALMENPYIATKYAASELVKLWSQRYDGPVSLATVFQVYGPGDDPANVLSYAARQISSGQPATFGSGKGLRDWIYISDAASALVAALAATTSHTPPAILEQDIGTGELRSIREMIKQLSAAAGSASHTAAAITFDSSEDRPDTNLVLKAINLPHGWKPNTTAEAAINTLFTATLDN